MYKVVQMVKRKFKGRVLQPWIVRRTYQYLPKDFNPEFISAEEVQENLENEFCNKDCCHEFKIISDLGSAGRPDIFSTRFLKERRMI